MAVKCGWMDAELMTCDDGSDARRKTSQPPYDCAYEGPLPPELLRRVPRIDTIEVVSDWLLRARREGWPGSDYCPFPYPKRRRWSPELKWLGEGRRAQRESRLFTVSPNRLLARVPKTGW